MKKFIYLACLFCIPSILSASGSLENSDFIERTINFVVFVAILWYFAADKIKSIFVNRSNDISRQLQSVQVALQEAKKDRDEAQKRLKDMHIRAKEIVESAKKEAMIIQQRYEEQLSKDIESMTKSFESSLEFEQRKLLQESVTNILNKLMISESANLSKDDYVNIITKRIS